MPHLSSLESNPNTRLVSPNWKENSFSRRREAAADTVVLDLDCLSLRGVELDFDRITAGSRRSSVREGEAIVSW